MCDPKVISQRLGHKSVEVTLRVYAHVLDTMQERAAKVSDAVFGPQVGVE